MYSVAGKMEKLLQRMQDISYINFLFSNHVRMAIIKFLYEKREGRWKEIVDYLRGLFGELNPNTINFHLSKLVMENVVIKEGDVYKLSLDFLDNDVVKLILNMLEVG